VATRRLFAFLRAINVGGRNIAMAELRRVFEDLGLKEVETFIASGNLIFVSDAKSIPALEIMIESGVVKLLGYEAKTFIRTEQELVDIVRYKPFKAAQIKTAQALNVAFISEPPIGAIKKLILAQKNKNDDFQVRGREVYWLCQTRQSDSQFNYSRFEKLLGARATWRGMNTINRLAAKYLPD
jgi:uncharacterized protein (DUF1697 family)